MFNFIKHRKIWYVISLLIIVPGLVSLALQGLNLGIDFTGGNLVEIRAGQNTGTQDVRGVVEGLGYGASRNVQKSGDAEYLIRTRELSEEESAALIGELDEKLGGITLLRNDRVGPVIGKELTINALLAMLVASILMLIYISYRFEFKQGIAAVIAILHDILVVLGIFSIFQLEVDTAFVAAILTVIGYSINDTIIVFDRIRENLKNRKKGEALDELVNTSIWQTMARSLNTVFTTMFVLLALYIVGGTTIKNFVLAMIIGIGSGVYSTIFNASPLWVDLKLREKKRRA